MGFNEVQYMRQWWLILLLVGIDVVTVIAFVVALPQMQPGYILLMSLPLLAATALLWYSHLVTEVRYNGLFIRYVPFHLSFVEIPLADVQSVDAVTYNPIRDYGGWGIKYGKGGKAYNVMGNRGVKIVYSNGRHILIGSQKPEELAQAVRSVIWQ